MRRDDARGVCLLALGQTSGFAALLFCFGALLVALEASGWSRSELAWGPTLGLLVAAGAAPLVGRLIDGGQGVWLLPGAAALGGLALIGLARAETLAGWYLGWALNGLAMAGSLFEACFAYLTRRLGPEARAAIIRVTLVAGFAASLSFPLGAWAGGTWGWRGGFLAFAALQLAVTLPADLAGLLLLRRGLRRGRRPEGPPPRPGALAAALRHPGFRSLALLLAVVWLNHGLVTTYALVLLGQGGLSAALAVALAAAIGPLQVLGRLLFLSGGRGLQPRPGLVLVGTGLVAAGLLLVGLGAAAGSALAAAALALLFVAMQGLSAGVVSILRPLAIAEVLGRESYGTIAGAIAMAPLAGTALAPVVGAALIARGGTGLLSLVVLGLALIALSAARALHR